MNPNVFKNIKFKHVWQTNKYFKWETNYATTGKIVSVPLPSSVGREIEEFKFCKALDRLLGWI